MTNQSSIDTQEVAKFAQHADQWWDREGPLKVLHDINPIRLELISKYQKLAQKIVLDVGCGGGILAEAMAREGARVTGLDVEEGSIAIAKAHAKQQHLDLHYLCCPVEEYQGENCDMVTCMELLEHVKNPKLIIEHCAMLLKPGGYLFLSTINRTLKAYLGAILAGEYILGLLPKQTHDFSKFIKPSELAAMIREVGLELCGLTGMTYHPFTRKAKLQTSPAVNYFLAARKPTIPFRV